MHFLNRFNLILFLTAMILTIMPFSIVLAQVEDDSYPVFLDEIKILTIKYGGATGAQERADNITKEIKDVAKNRSIQPDEIKIIEKPSISEFAAGDNRILVITDKDAEIIGVKREVYAEDIEKKLKKAIVEYRARRSLKNYILAILYTILTTLGFIIIFKILWISSVKLLKILSTIKYKLSEKLHMKEINLIPTKIFASLLKLVLNITRAFIFLAVLATYFITLLGYFPGTQMYKAKLYEQINSIIQSFGESILNYVPHLFFIIIVSLTAYYINQIVKHIFSEIKEEHIKISGFHSDWAKPTDKIIRFIVWAMAFAAIFPHLPGASSGAFQGVSVFIGVLVSLGSTAVVANIVAGILLIYTRAFKKGDVVKIADTIGFIQEGTLVVTRLRTVKNEIVSIPNSIALGSHIINYSATSKETGLILHTEITIGYDVPWKEVHKLLYEAALATNRILEEPKPFIFQTALGNYSVSYELNAYTDTPQRIAAIMSELHQNIQDKFNEAKIEILSPDYVAFRNGNKSTIIEDSN